MDALEPNPSRPAPGPHPAHRILAAPERARLHLWGVRDYGAVLALQERLRTERQADAIPDTWLVGEHPTVVTHGVRGRNDDIIRAGHYPVFEIDRGGMTTIHNPGQLVIYPIVRTRGGLMAQARMSRTLLETVRDWIAQRTGVALEIPRGRPGLFAGDRKAAAIGISIHGRVTMHGIAINCCNDLSPWEAIVPCGEPGVRPITLSELAARRIEPGDFINNLPVWLQTSWGYREVKDESESI